MEKVFVDPVTGCWNWTGARDRQGYGRFNYRGRSMLTHRAAWLLFKGLPVPLVLDHRCGATKENPRARNRACCNVLDEKHLRPETRGTNTLIGDTISGNNRRKTHCKRGHPFDKNNTWVYVNPRGDVKRRCRACARGD